MSSTYTIADRKNNIPVRIIFDSVPKGRISLFGEWFRTGRFNFFLKKGTVCVQCGLEGTFFRIVEEINGKYLQLCGRRDGVDIPLTKDHRIPRSLGGRGDANLQTMCLDCNNFKSDQLDWRFTVKVRKTFNAICIALSKIKKIWFTF